MYLGVFKVVWILGVYILGMHFGEYIFWRFNILVGIYFERYVFWGYFMGVYSGDIFQGYVIWGHVCCGILGGACIFEMCILGHIFSSCIFWGLCNWIYLWFYILGLYWRVTYAGGGMYFRGVYIGGCIFKVYICSVVYMNLEGMYL